MSKVESPEYVSTDMVCARCGVLGASASRCPACGDDPLLDGRYRLERRLGQGASGTTFAATRLADGQRVAVKELLVRALDDFKALDLFKREAGVLETIDHPGIPRYFDDFTFGEGRHLGLYLVTELIDGLTLEEERKLHRHTQEEVVEVGRDLCDILVHLHGLAPPVIHRDLKPSNIMRRKGGGLVLIDFGAVKESVRVDGGSTVAGTFGFMPPEQLAGRASPGTDLYALGVTLVVLISGRSVNELLDEQNRLLWREHLPAGTTLMNGLREVLGDVLEPDPGKRLGDARELRRRFEALLDGSYRPSTSQRVPAALLDAFPQLERLLSSIGHGGPLVAPGVADPPPLAPRKLGWGFAGKADPLGGFFRWFGLLFGGIPLVVLFSLMSSGVPGPIYFMGLFPLVGLSLATFGFVRAARVKRLFRYGRAAEAVVTDVAIDGRLRVNGRSPHRVTFRYRTDDGAEREGTVSRFRIRPDLRVPGARVYALYDENDPRRVTMWPLEA